MQFFSSLWTSVPESPDWKVDFESWLTEQIGENMAHIVTYGDLCTKTPRWLQKKVLKQFCAQGGLVLPEHCTKAHIVQVIGQAVDRQMAEDGNMQDGKPVTKETYEINFGSAMAALAGAPPDDEELEEATGSQRRTAQQPEMQQVFGFFAEQMKTQQAQQAAFMAQMMKTQQEQMLAMTRAMQSMRVGQSVAMDMTPPQASTASNAPPPQVGASVTVASTSTTSVNLPGMKIASFLGDVEKLDPFEWLVV